jgi:DNA-binding NarL/FixJ family response regulator
MASRVLLLSNNNLFRQCLATAIHVADSSLQVDCERADQGTRAVERLTKPDLVILDLSSDQVVARQSTLEVSRRCPGIPILAVGISRLESEVLGFLEAGATEYVSKEESLEEMLSSIARALRGDTRCPPELARAAFERLRELSRQRSRPDNSNGTLLTQRERQILELIATGLSNKEIARELHLSLHTVKNHVHRILEKLEVKSRYEAVQILQKDRLVS